MGVGRAVLRALVRTKMLCSTAKVPRNQGEDKTFMPNTFHWISFESHSDQLRGLVVVVLFYIER